eukprot:TRINITY_DN3110_c0_g2_i7.p1 TRINITY_DN3110_c0_g2~~TRINITY_DN3110_c0_g2_i7.p1  ORF type:complete len:1054 (+),score=125.80 TRINITY_DN3110_c0_g2_i7:225-3164(+)
MAPSYGGHHGGGSYGGESRVGHSTSYDGDHRGGGHSSPSPPSHTMPPGSYGSESRVGHSSPRPPSHTMPSGHAAPYGRTQTSPPIHTMPAGGGTCGHTEPSGGIAAAVTDRLQKTYSSLTGGSQAGGSGSYGSESRVGHSSPSPPSHTMPAGGGGSHGSKPGSSSRLQQYSLSPAGQQSQSPAGQHTYSKQTVRNDPLAGGMLKVRLVGASHLRNTGLGMLPGDVSDPFLVARLGKYVSKMRSKKEFVPGRNEFKTEVVENSLHPVWRRSKFEFHLESEEEDVLRFEIFSANSLHDSLGSLEVSLRHLGPQSTRICERLEDGDEGTLEAELTLLTAQQVREGDVHANRAHAALTLGPGGCTAVVRHGRPGAGGGQQGDGKSTAAEHAAALAHRQYLSQKAVNKVPLPDFASMGKEAFEPPPRKIEVAPQGELRKKMEYQSEACHLGQYDYSGDEPIYFPKQEIVDKGAWQADPFYGWRSKDDEQQQVRQTRPVLGDRNRSQDLSNIGQELVRWNRDPFHGWLTKDQEGHVDPNSLNGKDLEAKAARHLAKLPSFHEAPRQRFEDHREYAGGRMETRGRPGDPRRGRQENDWSHDAFYGWLPGRGSGAEDIQMRHRPLQKARDMACPSFSEQVVGAKGRGVGVLKIWINSASHLEYGDDTGIRGYPSACVKVRVGNREKITETIRNSANPQWPSSALVFEVEQGDHITVEVWDLETRDHSKIVKGSPEHFLGRHEVPAQKLAEALHAMQNGGGSRLVSEKGRLSLRDTRSTRGTIDYDWLFETYGTEVTERQHARLRVMNDTNNATLGQRVNHTYSDRPKGQPQYQRSLSHISGRSNVPSVRGGDFIGVLSVKVIRAFDLVNKDSGIWGDVSDPYVSIHLRSKPEKRERTLTVKDDLNPVWNSKLFSFNLEHEHDDLIFEVFDDDNHDAWLKHNDETLGKLAFPVRDFIHSRAGQVHRRKEPLSDIEKGELQVEIEFHAE